MSPRAMEILGVPVHVINMETTVDTVIRWAKDRNVRQVFLRDIHGLMRAVDDQRFRALHAKADLVLPDGMPLAWVGKLRGHKSEIGRTAGADVVDEVCRASVEHQLSHYFFGGKPGIAEKMAEQLQKRHPGLKIAGTYSPPMRNYELQTELTMEELNEIYAINESKAQFIWIGISTPKQEIWMSKASRLLNCGVVFGVGAAFDFHAGEIKRAPKWMRGMGLEWAHRFASEPRRLWRRYLVLAPKFLILFALSSIRR